MSDDSHDGHWVCLGGGTGLSTLLGGLREAGIRPTGLVVTFDDGGSSGVLSTRLGIPAVGDLRRCLSSLTPDPLTAAGFEARLRAEPSGVRHPVGNLHLARIAAERGLAAAVSECAAALEVEGRVLPISTEGAVLGARRSCGEIILGESLIGSGRGCVERVAFSGGPPPAFPAALDAIEDARVVVLGPGSLATSVLPHLAIPAVAAALRRTRALRVYVANITGQDGESAGLDVAGHLALIQAHAGPVVDVVLAHARRGCRQALTADRHAIAAGGARLVVADLQDPAHPERHHPVALAHALARITAPPPAVAALAEAAA